MPKVDDANEETAEERIFFHDDDAFHVRTDWFLVAHAILFEALFAAHAMAAVIVWCFGTIAAWGWLAVAVRHLPHLDREKSRLRRASTVYADVQRARAEHDSARDLLTGALFPIQHATKVFGHVLPWACLVAWLLLGSAQLAWWQSGGDETCLHAFGDKLGQWVHVGRQPWLFPFVVAGALISISFVAQCFHRSGRWVRAKCGAKKPLVAE